MKSIRALLLLSVLTLIAQPAFAADPPADPPAEPQADPPAEPPPEVPAEPPPARKETASASGSVSYDKGFKLTSPDEEFQLKIVGRVQPRWELFRADDGDSATDEEFTNRFQIARARLTLEGHAFQKVGFKMQTDFGKGNVALRDFYLEHPVGPAVVRVGQFKKPYSRQQVTSSGNQQLVDRSITDAFSAAGRDIGVALHNNYEKSPDGLEWAIGVFNGTSDKSSIGCSAGTDPDTMEATVSCKTPSNVPDDIGPQLVARAGWNIGGIKGYSESDLEGGGLRAAIGASYMVDLAQGTGDAMVHRIAGDVIVKAGGASVAGGVYFVSTPSGGGDRESDVGLHAQAGYFIMPKHLEVAGRFGMIPAGDESQLEILGGLNLFGEGHALKLQTDAGILKVTGDPSPSTFIVRTQAQLIF